MDEQTEHADESRQCQVGFIEIEGQNVAKECRLNFMCKKWSVDMCREYQESMREIE